MPFRLSTDRQAALILSDPPHFVSFPASCEMKKIRLWRKGGNKDFVLKCSLQTH